MHVSVVVPTLDSERFLPEALESAGLQSGVKIELLVVDGGSQDQTVSIARKFGAKVIHQRGRGLSDAWNAGIQAASHSLVAMLDSDDLWVPDTLAPRADILHQRSRPAICVGATRHFLSGATQRPGGFRPHLFDQDTVAPIPGAMLIDRRVFEQVGWFDTDLVTAGDADWVARAINHAIDFCEFPHLVLRKRVHDANLTLDARKVGEELIEVARRSMKQKRSRTD